MDKKVCQNPYCSGYNTADRFIKVGGEKYFPLLKEWDNCLIFNKSDEDNYNKIINIIENRKNKKQKEYNG